jgi:hypothetical protein
MHPGASGPVRIILNAPGRVQASIKITKRINETKRMILLAHEESGGGNGLSGNKKKPMKKFVFSQKLGWSVSRYSLFETCKRQYYYNYYAKYDPEYPLKKILALKKMTSIPLEVGNIVHDINKTTAGKTSE